jgi:ABC-type multidrug transport system ATPase subunit
MIADLDPNTGEVRLDGVLREAMSGPAWRRKASYVAAESGWWRDTPSEHFAPEHREAGRAFARKLGVRDGAFDEGVGRLSTGERQRLALVRALVLDPPVLLLDEPTGPLDPESVGRVEAVLVERLAAGTTIILVSHDPSQARRMGADRRMMRNRRLEPFS